MSLTVEDGSIVDDADSYVTVAEVRTFCTKRGLSLPADDADVETLVIKAMDYIEAMEEKFQGSRVSSSQSLAWPRGYVIIHGNENASDNIPKNLKNALCRLAFDAQANELQPNGTGKEIKSQGIGPLRKEFFKNGVSASTPELTAFDALIRPLLSCKSGSAFLQVQRG